MKRKLLWITLLSFGFSSITVAQNVSVTTRSSSDIRVSSAEGEVTIKNGEITVNKGNNSVVSGKVKDANTGEELVGVVIRVVGTNSGTTTDMDGHFALTNVASDASLEFSYIGMETLKVKASRDMNIAMSVTKNDLDELVVIGYGTARKRDLTGSIVSVSGNDVKNSPNYNPISGLQGKVPGLTITNSGAAGGQPDIKLRGVATTKSGTQPLYVVDGMFVDNIDFISPNDIVSMEVLKDPSSLAIFGVQGANGVIILSTKRAEKGKLSLSYDGYVGMQILHDRDRLKLTNASEFTMLYNEQLKNEATIDHPYNEFIPNLLGKGTDWQDEVLRNAMVTNHSISVSQATDKSNTLFSLSYFKQEGIQKYEDYSRFNARFAAEYTLNKNIKVGANLTVTRWDKEGASGSVQNASKAFPTYAPYAPKEDWDPIDLGSRYTPSPNQQKDVPNPVAAMELRKGNNISYGYRGVGNIFAEIKFLNDFTFKATGYADIGINQGQEYTPRYSVNNSTSISSQKSEFTSIKRNSDEYKKLQGDYILNYNKTIGDHRIGAMGGYTWREQISQGFWAKADTLVGRDAWNIHPDLQMLETGSKLGKSNGDWYNDEAFVSWLWRGNYSYKDKYLLTASLRADKSSKFFGYDPITGEKLPNKFEYFPSFGLGWVISSEDFMKDFSNTVDHLKMRASWGRQGNDKVGGYPKIATINPIGQQVTIDGVVIYIPTISHHVDPNLKWETITGFDFGIEGVFLNNKLSVDLGYYNKTTHDLLDRVHNASTSAAILTLKNVGSIRNSGIEYVVSWRDRKNDFSYGVSVNGATINNKVIHLEKDISDAYHRTDVGTSVGALFGYIQDGIFQNQSEIDVYNAKYDHPWKLQPGDIRYKDMNGDNKLNDKDRTTIGSIIPEFTYGISLNAAYKQFDMTLNFAGVEGIDIVNIKKLPTITAFNYYKTTLDRWHGEGTSNKEPILSPSHASNNLMSTNLLEDGSYFRLREIQLGYTLAKKLCQVVGVNSLRFYLNAQNPLTFKHNSGYTPEIGGGILNGGVDNGSTYPIPTTYTFGVSLTL